MLLARRRPGDFIAYASALPLHWDPAVLVATPLRRWLQGKTSLDSRLLNKRPRSKPDAFTERNSSRLSRNGARKLDLQQKPKFTDHGSSTTALEPEHRSQSRRLDKRNGNSRTENGDQVEGAYETESPWKESESPRRLRITREGSTHASSRATVSYKAFVDLVREEERHLVDSLDLLELAQLGIKSDKAFMECCRLVRNKLQRACALSPDSAKIPDPLFTRLRAAFVASSSIGLLRELKFVFQKTALELDSTAASSLEKIADVSHPMEWYPETRQMQRKIHLHVGPTNSGKTYHALKRLEEAETGFYAGPLRLLAQEVYTRLNARGKLCALITGEERKIPEGQVSVMSSCTVEMLPVNTRVDIAVIDEIQMISDTDRGWAWTNAFLGVQAKEVHLCGELRTVKLIEQLCQITGESLEIHKYERLTALESMKTSLKGDMKNLEKGDCIISFSRVNIHLTKKEVEAATGRKCAVVYGGLPPETRTQQSALFNDPNNDYDFLAASDAVGMGLNLSIKRIVFQETSKFDGENLRTMGTSEIKQIAGRAGRFRTAVQDNTAATADKTLEESARSASTSTIGLVTTFEDVDLPIMIRAMNKEAKPLQAAAVMPLDEDIVRFASYYPPQTPLSFILQRMAELSTTGRLFFFSNLRDKLDIADTIQNVNLTLRDRLKFASAPATREGADVFRAFAKIVAEQSSGDLLDIPELDLELLESPISADKQLLRRLEALHKALTLYLWLSFRFPSVFKSQNLAAHVSTICEIKIGACLDHATGDRRTRNHEARARRIRARQNDFLADAREKILSKSPVAVPPGWTASSSPEHLRLSEDSEKYSRGEAAHNA